MSVHVVHDALSGVTPADAPAFSEDALAQEFTRRNKEDWRYVAPWGRWLRWDGTAWRVESTLHVYDLARQVCRDAAEVAKATLAGRIASAQTRAAVVSLAQADRAHAARVEQWDVGPWLLATPDGVVDLRTGDLRSATREDYVTKTTAVGPRDVAAPTWEAFLRRVTGDDHELMAFLQRVVGYALTGSTREHSLYFMYGTGANGKSTFLNTIYGLLGDYAVTAPMETFTVSVGDKHPTDVAMLRGARLVVSSETEDGRRWAESKLKSLTGGDPITARFMRADFFTYTPVFKLLLSGNHRPALRNVDEAIRRRFHLVPFTEVIPVAERDPHLPEKLRAEWPGVLAWAIRGCLEWQAKGLRPPARVTTATTNYFAAEDSIGRWLEDCCDLGRQHSDTAARLFASWKAWAESAEEYVGSKKRLSQRLEERGLEAAWVFSVRGFRGVRVRQ